MVLEGGPGPVTSDMVFLTYGIWHLAVAFVMNLILFGPDPSVP